MKAQTSGEFFIIFSGIMMLYTIVAIVYGNWLAGVYNANAQLEASGAVNRIAFAVNFVHLAGEGAEYVFPMAASNSNITIRNTFVDANSSRTTAVAQWELLTNNTNFTIIKNTGNVTIRNNGGMIEIR